MDSGIDEVEESGERGSKCDDVFCFAPNKNRRMFFRDGGIAATSVAVSALGLASNPSVASAGNPKSRTEGYAVQPLSLVHNDLVGRVVDRGGDDMGRWTFIRYAGKNDKFLTIVTAR